VIDPRKFGFGKGKEADLRGAEPEDNAKIIEAILAGGGPDAARAAVILNAAGAIFVGGGRKSFEDAVGAAKQAIQDGGAKKALQSLRSAYRKPQS
jgi:anthranilate phosphoribosyltransferase